MENKAKRSMSIDEFKAFSQPEMWTTIKGESQTFYQCHCKIYEKTGIWIEELVPIFQKLDANLQKK